MHLGSISSSYIVWQIRDGHHIIFFMAKLVSNGYFLMLMTKNQLINSTLMVKDVFVSERKCDLNFQHDNLPCNIANQEVALLTPIDTNGLDLLEWKGINTRLFTI